MKDLWIDGVTFMDPDRIPVALMAVAIVSIIGAVSGPVAGNANPLIWLVIDKVFGGLGDRLDRARRLGADLLFRGFLVTAFALFAALALARVYKKAVFIYPLHGLTESVLLSTLITAGSLWSALMRLYGAFEHKRSGTGAYYAISRSARANLTAGDDFGVTRTAMNLTARAFDKGLVAPVFWYLVGGLPVALVYSVLAALAWRFGRDGFTAGFGAVPLALERLPGFIPSLYAAILIVLAGLFTPTARIHKGLSAFFGMKNRAPYEQGGFPLSALAWSLNLGLGGPRQDLSGNAVHGVWTGPQGATARNDHKHLRRALYISVTAHILFLASLCGAYLWAGLIFP